MSKRAAVNKKVTPHPRNPEAIFESVFRYANDAILIMRTDMFVDCNPKTEQLFGCKREDILQRKPHELSPPKQPDGSASKQRVLEVMNAASAGKSQFFEWTHKRLDGSLFDAEVSLNHIEIEGKPTFLVIVRDITERKKAAEAIRNARDELESEVAARTANLQEANTLVKQEIGQRKLAQEALQQSEAKYHDLVENANSVVLEMDTTGHITFVNKFAQEFFGYTESEIVGKNVIGTVVPPTDTAGRDLKTLIRAIVRHPETHSSSDNENMRQNGERVWVSWTNKGIYDTGGKLSRILCIGWHAPKKDTTFHVRDKAILASGAGGRYPRAL